MEWLCFNTIVCRCLILFCLINHSIDDDSFCIHLPQLFTLYCIVCVHLSKKYAAIFAEGDLYLKISKTIS